MYHFYIFISYLLGILVWYSSTQNMTAMEINHTKLYSEYDHTVIVQKLGYDPAITIYPALPNTSNSDQVTVYVHGWGDSQKSIDYIRRNSWLLPGTVIGFDFHDANFGAFLPDFTKSSFCQGPDIAALLLVLQWLDDCNIPVIHLHGHSRGAGTIITLLARILHFNKHTSFFNTLGISRAQASKIFDKIRNGTIILDCPFVDIDSILKHKLSWFGLGFLSPIFRYSLLTWVTAYRPGHDNPLDAARTIKYANFNILVYFEKEDIILGNNNNEIFYKNILGPSTYLIVGNDGGHIHTGKTLGTALQQFNKLHHASYYTLPNILNDGAILLSQAQPKPNAVDNIFITAYNKQIPIGITNYDDPQKHPWQQTLADYDIATVMAQLGYNPHVTIYPSDTAITQENVIVYAHGYGENRHGVIPFWQRNSYLLPGTVVGFDFSDVIAGSFRPYIAKTNLAQAGDIATLATILKMIDECGVPILHLFGTSRGGATIVNTLARLYLYDNYTTFFASLGISKKQAIRIYRKIKQGTIVLNCPLVDSRSAAQFWFGNLSSWIINKIVPSITQHNPEKDQAIESAKVIKNEGFTILVHFEYNDRIVGNTQDSEFYKNIMGPNTYLVLADEGGHLHQGRILGAATQALRQQYNAPHYTIPTVLSLGQSLLKQGQPTMQTVDTYVREQYQKFARQRAKK
jgi:hypothetical protein